MEDYDLNGKIHTKVPLGNNNICDNDDPWFRLIFYGCSFFGHYFIIRGHIFIPLKSNEKPIV